MQTAYRNLKRFIVLVPGLILAYVAAQNIFPFFDRHVPDAIAILITYVVTAYGLIPIVMRIIRIIFKPSHIPVYSTTPDGFASDPINIGIVGTKQELIASFQKAGWNVADKRTVRSLLKLSVKTLTGQQYKTAPFSSLYLLGRSQDIGFEKPFGKSTSYRHHVRFWGLTYSLDPRYSDHVHFWQQRYTARTPDRLVWIGAASRDIGIRFIRHNAQLTHMIHPDTNVERELIVHDLTKAQQIKSIQTIKASDPYSLSNRVLGGYLISDGELSICELTTFVKPHNS
ncbi:MAG: LssY C-terminal domain-containing protein [Candidatus Saccharimonadales bacterium]